MNRIGRLIAAVLIALCIGAVPVAQVRDTSAPAPSVGTTSISGIVLDDQKQPVHRAFVRVDGTVPTMGVTGGPNMSVPVPARVTVTGADGRFSFERLPPGRLTLSASKPSYVTTQDGATRPGRPGTSIVVSADARLSDLVLTMVRGAVITGRVVDPRGEPVPGVTIRVLRSTFAAGGRTYLLYTSLSSSPALTDDRGVYRYYGLLPGDYVVGVVPPRLDTGSAQLVSQADVDRALRDAQSPTVGRQGGTPGSRGALGGQAVAEPEVVAYVPVFYPGVTSLESATPITLRAGEERAGTDLRVELIRTVKVDGTVVRADGQPLTGARVALMPNSSSAFGSVNMSSSPVASDGTFKFNAVVPGDYIATAITGNTLFTMMSDGVMRTVNFTFDAGVQAASGPAAQTALADVTIGTAGLSGLKLAVSPGSSLTGKLVFDGSPATTRNPADYSVSFSPRPDVNQAGRPARGAVSPFAEFSISAVLPGRYNVNVTQASGASAGAAAWVPTSVIVNGREVIDTGVDVASEGALDATVTLTDRVASLSGAFQDASGKPATDFTIVLFTTDRTLWRWQARRIKALRPSSDGRFSFPDVPFGEYFLTALTDIEQNEWFDPQLLDQLIPASIRLNIAVGEKKVQDIRMK